MNSKRFTRSLVTLLLLFLATECHFIYAQQTKDTAAAATETPLKGAPNTDSTVAQQNTSNLQTAGDLLSQTDDLAPQESESWHQSLKRKFIEGDAGFMALVAIPLILGLALCIERIIFLTLSEINAKKFMADLRKKIEAGDLEAARTQCLSTNGPVAQLCLHGLEMIDDRIENVERTIVGYGEVQTANLEKGCSWITLFINMAPSLGFLGTVIGMVMAFEQIQITGDLNATVVASGMKVALITTIFGIIVALILQLFYNYILSKIEHITCQMEEAVIEFLTAVMHYKMRKP